MKLYTKCMRCNKEGEAPRNEFEFFGSTRLPVGWARCLVERSTPAASYLRLHEFELCESCSPDAIGALVGAATAPAKVKS